MEKFFSESKDWETVFTEEDRRKFEAGIFYNSYEKMGAHPTSVDGVKGVHFAVWAPNAISVSVVGDFNDWNGTRHPMKRLEMSGIHELFVPGVTTGASYQYEVKSSKAELLRKSDPYAFHARLRPATASVVWDEKRYKWNDDTWMKERSERFGKEKPLSVYEVHLGSWMQKEMKLDAEGKAVSGSEFCTYKELAKALAFHVKELGFTHIELMPIMEHPLDASWGYQITGYYAPTSRYGTPDEFKAFIDQMHQEEIGVILDWNASHFPKDGHGLAEFDGTCLYEHLDPRQGENREMGTLIYNYGRPQVSNFLISNALYWAKEFHVDGIRMASVDSLLYLDYGKQSGEWIANIYGGNENLEAVEFIKHLNSIFHRDVPGAITIAEESTAWPRMTSELMEDGLGFDYKWNAGWQHDLIHYMQCEPHDRSRYYGDLTLGMLYAYSENYVQGFSHAEVAHGYGSVAGKMPGASDQEKLANVRTAYGYLMGHPGKKHLFMGQEFGQMTEWSGTSALDWELKDREGHVGLLTFVKALNRLYQSQPACYELDHEPDGFEWINCTSDQDNILVFARYAKNQKEALIFICNFSENGQESYRLGVPFAGIYREILNSDAEAFGGTGVVNEQALSSSPAEVDNRDQSITIRLAPISVSIFKWVPGETEVISQESGLAEPKNGKYEKEEIVSSKFESPIHPVQTAIAAGEAIAKMGAETLDKLSERVGKIRKKK